SDYGTSGQVLTTDGSGILTWSSAGSSSVTGSFYQQGGNSFATTGTLGLNDANDLLIITDGTMRARFNATDGSTEITPAVSGTTAIRSLTITQANDFSQPRIILATGGTDTNISLALIPSG